MSFDNMTTAASNQPVRSRVTIDSLFSQAAGLIDQASGLAGEAERIADELCGSTPEALGQDPDTPRNGKLEVLAQMLDMISHHQHRARIAQQRTIRVVAANAEGSDIEKVMQSQRLSGGLVGSVKERY